MDTHKRYSQIAIVDTDGSIIDEGRFEHSNDFIELEALAPEFAGSQVDIDATGDYPPICDKLDHHMVVTLVHP